ncbi:AlbA family DNA-binding domain-containing protein [Enterococcus hirae]|nr:MULTISPECIES: RNA-binding domain-containing protein [Enterococcus]MDP8584155.1 putative DNA binding domain-containing protein [Listeria innocua]EMF0062700.1 putative DNA binding domain-containing protein [Enterococcus hirae]EMF0166452.1 putative DNA binding domain-containing protein [Enterococcus hirae]EMF0241242.1 putative DNA binding domain-containing protein [Enterococcus hirae]EMF0456086.1 putative DNA binding domain-containing protein [Enterococcus hirae]
MNELVVEIKDLISSKTEGGYWDFKRSWHKDDVSLLHDIICFSNNLENRDCYIIIGVDENDDFSYYPLDNDTHRKNNNELVTFLRDKKFTGGIRPTVILKHLEVNGNNLDVIIVKNTLNTPYTLDEDFPSNKNNKKLRARYVYTRINDANTPKDKNADLDKVEYLWRKRFGVYLDISEKLNIYLSEIDNWIYDDSLAKCYYKFDPLFTIKINDTDEGEGRQLFWNKLFTDDRNFRWEQFTIYYANVELYQNFVSYLDGSRHLIAIPKSKLVYRNHYADKKKVYFYEQDSIQYKVNNILIKNYADGTESNYLLSVLDEFVITFSDSNISSDFFNYLNTNMEIFDSCSYPEEILRNHYQLDSYENKEFVNAKKIKWIFENKYSKN